MVHWPYELKEILISTIKYVTLCLPSEDLLPLANLFSTSLPEDTHVDRQVGAQTGLVLEELQSSLS